MRWLEWSLMQSDWYLYKNKQNGNRKRDTRDLLHTSAHTHTHTHTHRSKPGESKKVTKCQQRKKTSEQTNHAGSLILAFQPPELWEIYFNCLWQSVSGILIWQPWQTLNPLLDVKLLKSFYLSNYLSLSPSPFLFNRAALLLPFILLFLWENIILLEACCDSKYSCSFLYMLSRKSLFHSKQKYENQKRKINLFWMAFYSRYCTYELSTSTNS